jgi:hypothetical protein
MPNPFLTACLGICSSAVSTLIGIFGTLLRRGELGFTHVFMVNALFTTLIQLSAEMRVKSPLLSANATCKFDTGLEVLEALSEFWLNAKLIRRLFEDSSEILQEELCIGKSITHLRPSENSAEDAADTHGKTQWQNMDSIPQAESESECVGNLGDTLDWSLLYWENPGFNFSNPFGDLGEYQPL